MRCFAVAIIASLALAGCTTTETSPSETDLQTPSEPAPDVPPVAADTDMISAAAADAPIDEPKDKLKPATGGAMPEAQEQDDGQRYVLGSLSDAHADVRDAAYGALEQRLAKTRPLGDGGEETIQLGDGDVFKYTVLRLLRGRDDVSGSRPEAADGMDVEVSGWYKRLVTGASGDGRPTCTSFDATVSLTHKDGEWRPTDGSEPQFGREDNEDCY